MTAIPDDWERQERVLKRRSKEPGWDPVLWVRECDWGYCNEPTVAWRWSPRPRRWVTVCAEHTLIPASTSSESRDGSS